MDTEMLLIAFLTSGGIIFLLVSWIRSAGSLGVERRHRVTDILVIGAILTFIPQFIDGTEGSILSKTGIFVLLYGLLILLVGKFKEGRNEKMKRRLKQVKQ